MGQRGRAFFGCALGLKAKTSQYRNTKRSKDDYENENLGSHVLDAYGGDFGGHDVIRPGG
jgi:hypothetical protein